MFDSIRSHRRWLMFFLIVLVFPSFVVTGIYSYNRFVGGDDAVARVGDQPITQQEFDVAQRQQLERLRGMLGNDFDPKMFDTREARVATLDGLLSERALAMEAQREGVLVTEDRVRRLIAAETAFQQNGKFDYERYKMLLQAQGYSEQSFEQRVRDDLQRRALLQAVSTSSVVPTTVTEHLRRLIEEERQVRELRFAVADFKSKVAVTDEQVKSFYEANANDFRQPETAKVQYVMLTLDDIARDVTVAEADALAYYEQNKARFGQDEQRKASHILFTAGDGGTAKDKAGARKKAEEVLAQLRANPKDFERLAKEFSKDPGSAANGGDLGQFGRNMMVKPFEDAAFKLKPGEISDIVESDFGFHIIKVTGVVPAQVKPFAEVRGEIEADLRRQAAQKKFAEAAEIFTNTAYEQADSLKPVADKLKLQVQTVEALPRSGLPARPGTPQVFTQRLLEALFSAESIKAKRNTEAIEVATNTLASARIVEHRPAQVRPLAEVRDAVKQRVEQREAARLTREAAEKRLAELRATPSEAGFGPVRTVGRSKPEGLSQAAINSILQPAAGDLPKFVLAELDGGNYGVFQVQSSKLPPPGDPAQQAQLTRGLQQAFGAADDSAYIAALKDKHKAVVLKSDFKLNPKDESKDAAKAETAEAAKADKK
jgi:peptidyl-prolyl cis-trans isomerase D